MNHALPGTKISRTVTHLAKRELGFTGTLEEWGREVERRGNTVLSLDSAEDAAVLAVIKPEEK